ncbi:unnamed protein product [Polarella glacialis]|uniref:Uncharacterized protein n=1 Tax=Polarella glacialis TaxID=89957 RepID=A0A813IPM5_POLGL|nr:unnamed protein product [Polarella glacialis]CAE8654662.1 unnamed protein product [Polarella glacialis]
MYSCFRLWQSDRVLPCSVSREYFVPRPPFLKADVFKLEVWAFVVVVIIYYLLFVVVCHIPGARRPKVGWDRGKNLFHLHVQHISQNSRRHVVVVAAAADVIVVIVTLPASDKKYHHQAETLVFLKKFTGWPDAEHIS